MKITFLGTGTSQGVPVVACECPVCRSDDERDKRLRSSVLIEVEHFYILIDAGPDFRMQMLRLDQKRLGAILLTHEHADHIFGLDDIRAFNWVQGHPMDIYAEKRVQESVKRVFDYVFEKFRYPGIPRVNLHLIENREIQVGPVTVLPVRGYHHRLPVYGFRIGKFAYLTDMKTIEPEEKEKLKGLDTLVVNALRQEDHISHFTLAEALALIGEVQPRQAWLTHISHMMGFHREVAARLPPHIAPAYDGLQLNVY